MPNFADIKFGLKMPVVATEVILLISLGNATTNR
jgi:hypothetical protein